MTANDIFKINVHLNKLRIITFGPYYLFVDPHDERFRGFSQNVTLQNRENIKAGASNIVNKTRLGNETTIVARIKQIIIADLLESARNSYILLITNRTAH